MGNYNANDGKYGYVYILENRSLASGVYKIGQTTRSGAARARDLNIDAKTGMPADYRCIFEHPTLDCGRAEKDVHLSLSKFRRGKRGQEFFEVEIEYAKSVIINACQHQDAVRQLEEKESEGKRLSTQEKHINSAHQTPASARPIESNDSEKISGYQNNNAYDTPLWQRWWFWWVFAICVKAIHSLILR